MPEDLGAYAQLASELAAQLPACTLCPRQCGVDRYVRCGHCGAGRQGVSAPVGRALSLGWARFDPLSPRTRDASIPL